MYLLRVGSLHRFWVQEREVNISEVRYITIFISFLQGLTMTVCVIILQEERARLRCRAITYAGEFEPVKRSCRAPLPNGTLCPRRDRVKVSYLMDNLCSFVWGSPVVACSQYQDALLRSSEFWPPIWDKFRHSGLLC